MFRWERLRFCIVWSQERLPFSVAAVGVGFVLAAVGLAAVGVGFVLAAAV